MMRLISMIGMGLVWMALPAWAIPHGQIIAQHVVIDATTVSTVAFPVLAFNAPVQPLAVQVVASTAVTVATPPQLAVDRGAPGYLDILPPTMINNCAVTDALTTFTGDQLSTGARRATSTIQPFVAEIRIPAVAATLLLDVTLFLYVP